MILKISNTYTAPFDENVYCMKSSMLTGNGTHLFIASNKWDNIEIELSEDIPVDKLRYLPSICNNITVRDCSNLSDYTNLLIVLFPEKGGTLRRCLLSKEDVRPVIKEHLCKV